MEGQRVDKSAGGGRKAGIIAGAAVGVLAAAYVGLCAWVGGQQSIFPNVSVAGIDVSNMTVEQAGDTLAQTMADQGRQVAVSLQYGDWSGQLTAAELELDWQSIATQAQQRGRDNFLVQGAAYLGHLMGGGENVSPELDGRQPALEQLLDQADRAVGGDVTSADYRVEDNKLYMTKGVTGVAVDRDETAAQVSQAFQTAFQAQAGGAGAVQEVTLTVAETAPQEPDFDAIHQAVYQQPQSAQLDSETYEITDHVVGVDFDPQVLKAAYVQAGEGDTFSIPLTLTQPDETRESLEGKLFKDLLGEGTTRVSGSANRKSNVKLSAEACNGIILLPGEEFSYNNTTGSRSADKGYKNAPIYQGGQSVDDIGGGICQTSSTIYYAVLHTNLEVVERHCHQFNTGYVTLGMDATVFYGSLDFRFKNSTDYPVKIVTSSYDSGGSRYLNVKIYGTNPEGIYAVPKSSTFDKVAPTTVYVPDASVPQGTLVLDREQYAYTGWSAHTYRYIYDKDGNEIDKQDMGGSKYKMRPNSYHYNPADGDPATWPNGQPPVPGGTVDPGTVTDPGTAVDPGTTTDPGTAVDPGAAVDPGTVPEPAPVVPEPVPAPSDTGLDIQTPPEGI